MRRTSAAAQAESMSNVLSELSQELAAATASAAASVVAVNARPHFSSSGIVWKPGVILTADHTIKRTDRVTVGLPNGETAPATVAGRDPGTDIAALRIEAGSDRVITPVQAALDSGHLVLGVGRSREAGPTAVLGMISAVSGPWRTWRGGAVDRFVRVDMRLYPGMSGAALVDVSGRLLGMLTGGLLRSAPAALPVSTLERVAGQLLTRGHVARGYLGLGLQPVALPDHLRKQLDLAAAAGVIVLSIEPDGPAGKAGLIPGDILVALGGQPAADTDDVQAAIGTETIGKALAVTLLRGGRIVQTEITVGERPRAEE